MGKEQIIDQMINEVKKTCEENGLEVLMLVGKDMGDKIDCRQLLRVSDGMMADMIYDMMKDDPHLAGIIQMVNGYYLSQKLKDSLDRCMEEVSQSLRNTENQTSKG